jgi:plastocyanin
VAGARRRNDRSRGGFYHWYPLREATLPANHWPLRSASALVALALVACGGGGAKNAASRAPSESTAVTPTPAAPGGAVHALPATGKVWDVKMYGDTKGYRFDPKTLTIHVGDAVRWVVVNGGPHDVTFWPDSIPKSAEAQLQANMPNTLGPLRAPMSMNAGEAYIVSFAGMPPGLYKY